MSTLIFFYNNLIDSATLTASSEATGFPASNLKNPFRTKYWKTAGATAGTAQLVINHGSAKAVTACALTGYPDWAAAPGTLNLEFDDHDAWGAPDHTEALTWVSNTTPGGNKGTIIKTFASKSHQYNRLSVVNAPGDWNLGRLFVGEYFEPTRDYSWGYEEEVVDPSLISRTIGGQDHADEIERYRVIRVRGIIESQAQWVLYQAMINTVGTRKEIFVAFDFTGEVAERTLYGKFTKVVTVARPPHGFEYEFEFTESR